MAGQAEEISEYFRHLHSSIPSAPNFFNLPLVTSSPPPRRAGDTALSNFESAAQYQFDRPETGNSGIASFYDARSKTYYWSEDFKSDISKKITGVPSENETGGEFSCDSEEPGKGVFVRYRSSSKRSRTAEIHNLSEKRRRTRINEKIKALQTLIPNSSKTDKVSMLDEAIEYLKQLQLKVQMLTMRKGLSMQTMCLQQIHQPTSGINFDDGSGDLNACKRYSLCEERTLFDISSSQRTLSNDSILLSPLQNVNHSFGFVPRYSGHFDTTISKDVGRGGSS